MFYLILVQIQFEFHFAETIVTVSSGVESNALTVSSASA